MMTARGKQFKPRSIDHYATIELLSGFGLSASTYTLIRKVGRELGYRFYVVDQVCGRCFYRRKVITIPTWVWKQIGTKAKQPGYCNQYVCHELAHAIDASQRNTTAHDDAFYAVLKSIAPPETMHYETVYKPRATASAGISPIPSENIETAETEELDYADLM